MYVLKKTRQQPKTHNLVDNIGTGIATLHYLCHAKKET